MRRRRYGLEPQNSRHCRRALFIVATLASLAGNALYGPILNDPDRLSRVGASVSPLAGGVLLQFVAAGASVGIAIALYPVLKQWGAAMALGSVVFRTLEATMYTIGAIGLLALIPLGSQFAGAAATERASLAALSDVLLGVRDAAGVAGVLAFSVGALLYYGLFYRSNLVPRWLSGWGIAALFLMVAACFLALFNQNPVTSYVFLAAPIGVQEIVLAVWLIVRGFRSAALASAPEQPPIPTEPGGGRASIQLSKAHP
jgi:Domain of unknown function (DUF4386)